MSQIRFDGKVAIVTGAGGGLGRAYAHMFAARGAKVVVNDLGGSMKGDGSSTKAADTVVEEIRKAGGTAVANYDSVENGEAIVETAVKNFGRIDILVNNAGILRDVSFTKMTQKDWDLIYLVHIKGAYACTKAAWKYMREQRYGRIIMTSSAAGLYGNVGQANYSSAKMALVSFATTLAKEGASRNIQVNAIAPMAGSRMTETVMPPELVAALKPDYIAPLVGYLCSETSDVTGKIYEVGAGWIANVRWERSQGHMFDLNSFSIEKIAENWEKVNDFKDSNNPSSANDSFSFVMENLERAKSKI